MPRVSHSGPAPTHRAEQCPAFPSRQPVQYVLMNEEFLPHDLVPHPRYGTKIRPGFRGVSEETLRRSYRDYKDAAIFPKSTIKANISEQNLGPMDSRPYYVDMLKKCRSCRRHFIFFAAEQQYWYETLKFYIDSECINCPECRQSIRRRKNDWECYSQLASRDELSDEELIHFIELSMEFWNDGMIGNPHTIRTLKNRAAQQLPDHATTSAIQDMVSEIPPQDR